MVDKRRAVAGVRKMEGVGSEFECQYESIYSGFNRAPLPLQWKRARNGHDMRAGRTDRACNEHGPQAGAEGGGLNGSTSSVRYYGVIAGKHSEAHLTE